MNAGRLCFVCAALAFATGCDELDKSGRLGHAEFEYQCGSPGDAACDGVDAIFGFDLDRDVLPIAVGGRFSLICDDDEASEIFTAAPALVPSDGATFAFDAPGTVDFLARNRDGEVVDFVDFTGVAPDGIALFFDGARCSAIDLPSFGQALVAAAPTRNGSALGGGFSYDWTVSGEGVSLTQGPASEEGAANVAELQAEGGGATVTVIATMGSFSASCVVRVGSGDPTTSSSSSGGGSGGSGGGGAG